MKEVWQEAGCGGPPGAHRRGPSTHGRVDFLQRRSEEAGRSTAMARLVAPLFVLAAAGVAAGQGEPTPPARTDAVLRWNETALTAIRTARTPPPVAARNLATMHVAVFDA